jgi:hypothetical protein
MGRTIIVLVCYVRCVIDGGALASGVLGC